MCKRCNKTVINNCCWPKNILLQFPEKRTNEKRPSGNFNKLSKSGWTPALPGGVLHIRVDAGAAEMSAPHQGGHRRTSFCNLISFKLGRAGGRICTFKPSGAQRRERGPEPSRCQKQLGEESLKGLQNLRSLRNLACLINPGNLGRLSCLREPRGLRNPGGGLSRFSI